VEIVHRVGINGNADVIAQLRRLGVEPNVDSILVWFDISESAGNWPQVEPWIQRARASDVVHTEFSDAEIASARWLVPGITQAQGFPQPRDAEFGYREATFDTSEFCETCGVGMRQKAPFQMKGDPNWGRRGILQLHWVSDVFFAKPDVWQSVFKPLGVDARPVTKPSGAILEKVVQLVIDETVPTAVADLPPQVCLICGRAKYNHVVRGRSPAPLIEPPAHLVWSREWFGSGGAADHEVLMSGDLASAVRRAGVRGLTFGVAS